MPEVNICISQKISVFFKFFVLIFPSSHNMWEKGYIRLIYMKPLIAFRTTAFKANYSKYYKIVITSFKRLAKKKRSL